MGKLKSTLKTVANRRRLMISVIFITGALVGIMMSLIWTPRYATGAEIEAARRVIAEQYINESSVGCSDTSDPISPSGRIVMFYKYLRVNRYANRAVIRGCNDADSLLARKKDGTWIKTDVNMALDARVNGRWQNACNISDITVTDDQDRPENASIDQNNFDVCVRLRDL